MAVSLVIVSLFLMPVRCDLAAHPHSIHVNPAAANDAHREHASPASHETPRSDLSRIAPTADHGRLSTGIDAHAVLASGDRDDLSVDPAGTPFMTNAQSVIDHEAIAAGGIMVTLPSIAALLEFRPDGTLAPLSNPRTPVAFSSPPLSPPPQLKTI